MKKTIIVAIAFLLSSQLSFSASEDASTAMDYLRYVKCPVSAGMGGAGLASTSYTSMSSFTNVAGVPFSQRTFDVSAGCLQWNPSSTAYFNLGVSGKVKEKFGISFGTSVGLDKEFLFTPERDRNTGSFRPVDMQMNLGFGYRFIEWLSLGVNARFAMQKLTPDYILKTFLADVSLMAEYRDFGVALGVQNVGAKASYGKKSEIDKSYPVTSEAVLGVRWSPVFADVHALELDADFRYGFFGTGFAASAGAAYTYNDLVSLRCGGCYAGKTMLSHGSIGLGVKFFGVHIDAAYLVAAKSSPLANSFVIGLGYCF